MCGAHGRGSQFFADMTDSDFLFVPCARRFSPFKSNPLQDLCPKAICIDAPDPLSDNPEGYRWLQIHR